MTGADVTRLQERLRAIGLFSGAVDGVFGRETEAAVQQAQRNYNLEPDGIVGPATWEALLQGS
jgi:peptidoglycan hydrolase-like protein with peptidoglycan-binding domain